MALILNLTAPRVILNFVQFSCMTELVVHGVLGFSAFGLQLVLDGVLQLVLDGSLDNFD